MRIDSHQHFWQIAAGHCTWLAADMAPIYRDFGPDDLAPLLRRGDISATVLVQAAERDAETEWLLKISEQTDFVAGVVGWVDMTAADAPDRLQRLAEHPRLVGIRPMIQDIADPDWMLRPDLRAACHAITEHGLVFDALVLPKHLPNLGVFLARYPDMKVVIDHAAKPALRQGAEGIRQWQPLIRRVAEHPQCVCKLSGLLTEAAPNATAADLRPCADILLDAFGPERLLWGSDWPVLNLAADYERWLAITAELFTPLPPAARRKIMGENAAAFYRL